MNALSFKQPWAWLVAAGIKDVDNRTWWLHMPPFLNYPADPRRIYVHASKSWDYEGWEWICDHDLLPEKVVLDIFNKLLPVRSHPIFFGAIIGKVDIVACFHESQVGYPATKSPWFTGPYGLVLKNAVLYDKPIPCKGHQKFFKVNIDDRR
jgi:hypothetical protein